MSFTAVVRFLLPGENSVLNHALEYIADSDVTSFIDIIKRNKLSLRKHASRLLLEVHTQRKPEFLELLAGTDILPTEEEVMKSSTAFDPLLEAVVDGDEEWVKLLYKYKVPRNKSISPIFHLIKSVKINNAHNKCDLYKNILHILITHGENINEFQNNETPIFYAVKEELWHYVEILLTHGANVDTFCNGTTARMLIRPHKFKLLSNAATENRNIKYFLFESLLTKNVSHFKFLLRHNQEMCNAEDDQGFTLLQLAIQRRMNDAVYALLKYGADPNKSNEMDETTPVPPIIMTILSGQCDIFTAILYHMKFNILTLYKGNNTLYHILAKEWRNIHSRKVKNIAMQLTDIFFATCFEKGVNILQTNCKGKSAVNIACANRAADLLRLFFKFGGFSSINEKSLKYIQTNFLSTLFDECIIPNINHDLMKDNNIEIDYGFIDAAIKSKIKGNQITNLPNIKEDHVTKVGSSYGSTSSYISITMHEPVNFIQPFANLEMNLFHLISTSKTHSDLLKHPIVRVFLYLKWKKIFPIYFINVLLYILFTISLSLYLYNVSETYQYIGINKNENSSNISFENHTLFVVSEAESSLIHNYFTTLFNNSCLITWFLTLCFANIILIREVMQCKYSILEYISSVENLLEVTLLISVYFILFIGYKPELASISVILTYCELTLLFGRYPFISTYITIFVQVAKNSLSLLLLFCPLIFAFAFGFNLIFTDYKKIGPFENIGKSFFKTFMMINGEVELQDINLEISSVYSRVIFIIFLIFIVIAFSNVLNALAISDTQSIVLKAELLNLVEEVKLYSKLEKIWLSYFSHKRKLIKFLKKICCFGAKCYYNLNGCSKVFQDRSSKFKLFISPNVESYLSKYKNKLLYGFNQIKITKQLLKIIEDRKDYAYYETGPYDLNRKSIISESYQYFAKSDVDPYENYSPENSRTTSSCFYKELNALFAEDH